MNKAISRRRFIAIATATTTSSLAIASKAQASAQFHCKQFHNQPKDSPLHKSLVAMWAAVKTETGGRFQVQTFAQNNNIPGSDPQALKMLVAGELEFFTLWGAILGAVVPVAEIQALPFIFKNRQQVFSVMDGKLGDYLRQEMALKGIYGFPQGCFENGYRQISTSTKPISDAADLVGLKIRTPSSQLFNDFFCSLGAEPKTINFEQLYGALKDRVVDGQDNPINVIETNKFYEVQKYMSITNHMWSGFNLLANLQFWQTVPRDIQEIIQRNVVKYVARQRDEVNLLNQQLTRKLTTRGMIFAQTDTTSFRSQLAPFYARWRQHFGSTAWSLLETQVGLIG
ncbi:TRAP transporter substrate-binding protein [Synechocystis sp. PCC 7509]|uniref:TRAP transporter substrate-binding protein n=1 Tax=Synechocystis sp. PCC 7509 TaxID=927677 RepID=UPI000491AC72|nr:TRAP transporter substrate-binding protein [Synechocystis sp. PCC 7509]